MEKKKSKMAKDKLGMEPAVHRKELENKINSIEKDIDALVNKTKDGFNHNAEIIEEIIKKINILCKRFGITGL